MKTKAVLYINDEMVGETDNQDIVRQLFNEILSQKKEIKSPFDKIEYTLSISDIGKNKVAAIKAVRKITGMNLEEAKHFVESPDKSLTLKGYLNYENACHLLRNAGCFVRPD